MTKAFLVQWRIKSDPPGNFIWSGSSGSSPFATQCCGSFPQSSKTHDYRPILVIAKDMADVAAKYPLAYMIEEMDVKDVVISDKVDYLLEKR